MPKPHKKHWTQTPEGRRRVADITRNRHLRKRQEELKKQVEQEVHSDFNTLGISPTPTDQAPADYTNSNAWDFSLDGLIEEQQRLIKELKRVNKQIDHRLVDLDLN